VRSRRRIGVLAGNLNDEYQAGVVRGVRAAAQERGAQVRSFVGGELGGHKHNEPERNRLYDLVGPDNVDALIVLSGAIANLCGKETLAQFCRRFAKMPMCTLSGQVPGIPNILANNGAGVREAVSHLIRVHQRRRIGFIQGPPANQDAEERYQGYLDALAEHGIPVDASRILKGNFSVESGHTAIAGACAEGTSIIDRVDALIAADDCTAIGALRELARRKIAVPRQISVIGFDDVEESRVTTPPLSTIKQPFLELGAEAVRVVCAIFDGEQPPMHITLPTRAVFRRSCGCNGAEAGLSLRPNRSFEVELIARKDVVRAELQRATRGAFRAVPGWDDRILTSFAEHLRSGSNHFLVTFRAMLDSLAQAGAPATAVDSFLTALREQMIACLRQDTELTDHVEDAIRDARLAARSYAPSAGQIPATARDLTRRRAR
jgi:phosphoserine phosphatase RsbU/P